MFTNQKSLLVRGNLDLSHTRQLEVSAVEFIETKEAEQGHFDKLNGPFCLG